MNYSKSILDPVFLAHGTPSSFDLVRGEDGLRGSVLLELSICTYSNCA